MILGHRDILRQKIMYKSLVYFKNIYEFCRFLLCDSLPQNVPIPRNYVLLSFYALLWDKETQYVTLGLPNIWKNLLFLKEHFLDGLGPPGLPQLLQLCIDKEAKGTQKLHFHPSLINLKWLWSFMMNYRDYEAIVMKFSGVSSRK